MSKINRRVFLQNTGKAGLALGLGAGFQSAQANGNYNLNNIASIPYTQQPLPYAFNALEPVVDAMTMEIHYSKHAATYAKNLAEAVQAEQVDTSKTPLVSLLAGISKYSTKMRNNAGGHYNHELFWNSMKSPGGTNEPSAEFIKLIERDFGNMETFKAKFSDAAKTRFGSGWAWLVLNKEGKLVIGSTPNQDNPLMDLCDFKGLPLLCLDVWEHAYYLKYQNRRPDYINAWWNVVNWQVVESRLKA